MDRPRLLAALAAALLLPLTLVAVLRRAAPLDADLGLSFDPYDVDLQLMARND